MTAILRLRAPSLLLAAILAAGCRRTDSETGGRARPRSLPRTPDVVLITIDTLRADAPGFAGNTRISTPVLDRLASEGRVYTRAHAHNVVTLPSHVNILTGLLPYQHGVRDNSGFRLAPGIPTLAALLRPKGYATGAFVGAFPLDRRFGLAPGFDVYDDRYPRGKSSLDFEMPERPAAEVVEAARKWWIASAGKPRFLWVHLYDCHAPYRPPSPYRERYAAEPYLGEVAAVDAALAPLLDPLRESNAPPALVVVTGDHGEALGDHGEATHGLFAYEATLRVPLVIWMPGTVPAGAVDAPARHVDIAPTVLQIAGIERPAGWTGSSLLGPRDPASPSGSYFEAYSAAYNRGWAPLRGILADGWKYVDLPIPELYDEKSDPGEASNLAPSQEERLRALARTLPAESVFGATPRGEVAPEEARKLRSLGYLSGSAAAKKTYGPSDDPKNLVAADGELHRAIDLYQHGDLAGAIASAEKLVRERPTMAIAYTNLGFLLRQKGAEREALAVYAAAAKRGILDEELASHYALALSEAGRAADAVRVLQPFGESANPDTWNALGIAKSDSGQAPEATRAFERALELDPENVEALENLGIVRLRGGDPAGAEEKFRRALAIDSRLPRAWNGLGVAQAQLGREREAIDAWTRAVALDPKLYDALFNLGLTAGRNGMPQEARRALEQFVATAPPALYGADLAKARRMLQGLGTGS